MKQTLRDTFDVLLYLFTFLLIQVVVTAALSLIAGADAMTGPLFLATSGVSGLLTIVLYAWLGWSPFSREFMSSGPWALLFWTLCLGVGLLLPCDLLQEALGAELPDDVRQMFASMIQTDWGWIVVGIVAPAAEEVVFRGAILRRLLRMGSLRRPWTAIALSALLFGLVHLNLAQGVNAVLMGLVFGWLYWRTGSIVPGLVLHCVNNLSAVFLCRLLPTGVDARITDLYGGDTLRTVLALCCSLAIILASLFQIVQHLKRAPHMSHK